MCINWLMIHIRDSDFIFFEPGIDYPWTQGLTIPNTELLIHRNSIANCLCFEARIPEHHVSGRDCFVQNPKPIPIPKSFQSPNRFINTFQHHCESHMGCARDSESVLSLSPRCLSVVSPLSLCCLSEVSPGLSAVSF